VVGEGERGRQRPKSGERREGALIWKVPPEHRAGYGRTRFIEPLIAGSATVWDSLRFLCAAVAIPPLPMPIKGVVFRQECAHGPRGILPCRANGFTSASGNPAKGRWANTRTPQSRGQVCLATLSHAEPPP
jgi:hypothetical protein